MSAWRAVGACLLVVWLVLAAPGFALDQGSLITFAILIAAAFLVPGDRLRALVMQPRGRAFVIVAAAVAALISYLLIAGPMHDRPISIDARVYLLQARALSHGHFGMPIPEPRQLFGGRFLFEGPDGRLYGVFPPGFPLFLAPFVALGVPLLVGPVLAAALVFGQSRLGRALEGEDGFATRLSILLSLPSVGRAVETADLLSHAFVAVLATFAIALAIEARGTGDRKRLLIVGALLGMATISRLLDGLLISALVAVVLGRRVLWAIPAMLPFAGMLLIAQKTATGSFTTPTQTYYFLRSDWPMNCHRLGLGFDVGCAVEHGEERVRFGADGYTLDDAFRVVRSRASALGGDLLGFAPIGFLAFTRLIRRAERKDAYLAAAIVAFTLGYGLFYYGNAPIFGARHLFPIAALFWLLLARSVSDPLPRLRGLPVAVLAAGAFASLPRFVFVARTIDDAARKRVDVRAMIERSNLERGLIVTDDELSWIAAFDPWRDGKDRIVVRFDRSGLLDLRRTYPTLPIHNIVEGDQLISNPLKPPPPGVLFELERAWPSFVHPYLIGTRVVYTKACCKVESSGERALFVLAAQTGGTLWIPFTTSSAVSSLRVDGLVAPDYGTWGIYVDGLPLPPFEGYAPEVGTKKGETAQIALPAGRHVLTFFNLGKRPESRGYLGSFDALVGTP
jgi:hypothetical protein